MPRNEVDPDSPTAGLRIIQRTAAKFTGHCVLVPDHVIAKGDAIVLVVPEGQSRDFALGWACRACQDRIVRGV